MSDDVNKDILDEGKKLAQEYDDWAEENGHPTNAELEDARAAGRQSSLYFGTGVGTGVGDFPFTVGDTQSLNAAIAEAGVSGDNALTVAQQPGGATVVGTSSDLTGEERDALQGAGVRNAADPEQVGTADASVAGRNPVTVQPVNPEYTAAPVETVNEDNAQEEQVEANAEGGDQTAAVEENAEAAFADDDDDTEDDGDEDDQRNGVEVVADIKRAETVEEVDRLRSEREDLKTVRDAAEARRRQLADTDDNDENVSSVTAENPDSITVEHDE